MTSSRANRTPVPRAMTIAGSDSGGGAGIQADLKTFAALGVYGASVITAVTAQNTVSVNAIADISPDMVAAQIDAVMSDIGADAVKTGMLAHGGIIEAVAERIQALAMPNVVVDPVMVAKSGDRLLREEAVEAYRTRLLPLALVVTPNIPEAEALTGFPIETDDDALRAARTIAGMGARNVVIKGGHREGPVKDILYSAGEVREFTSERIQSKSTHGTGCTFASAIAAHLARGCSLERAVLRAKEYVSAAIEAAFPVGRGHGPMNHFYALWPPLQDPTAGAGIEASPPLPG